MHNSIIALSFFVVEIMLTNFVFLIQSICGSLFQVFRLFCFLNFFLCLCWLLFIFPFSPLVSFFILLWWFLDELWEDSLSPAIIYKSLLPESLKSILSGLSVSSMEIFNPLVVPQSFHRSLSLKHWGQGCFLKLEV